MKIIINRIFSEKYVAPRANVIQLLMYRIAYPFAVLLNKLHLSPNQITTQSLVFSILAFIALIYDEGWVWFSIFWGVSVLLDFCDGTVARMTDRVSKSAFRYDHMSDTFKISLLALGVGIRFDNLLFWILSSMFIFFYNYAEILSHDLKCIADKNKWLQANNTITELGKGRSRLRERSHLVGYLIHKAPWLYKLILQGYSVIATFNGHTLLILFAFPIGGWLTAGALAYLIFLTAISCFSGIKKLRSTSR